LYSQSNEYLSFGVGASIYSIDTKESSNTGLNFALATGRFYMDISSNIETGKGEELYFSSDETYKTNKIQIYLLNIGYKIIPRKGISIIPVIGCSLTRGIYQDPVGWDTFFYADYILHGNIGITGEIILFNNFGIYGGIGTFERYKIGAFYHFNLK